MSELRAGRFATWLAGGCLCACSVAVAGAQSTIPGQVVAPATPRAAAPPADRQADDRSKGIVVRGRVATPEGTAVAGAEVTLVNDRPGPVARTTADGRFEFKSVPPGRYVLRAARQSFVPVIRSLVVDADADPDTSARTRERPPIEDIDIVMQRGGVLTGRIADERGQPVPDVAVTAAATPGYDCGPARSTPTGATLDVLMQSTVGAARTNAKGEFRIVGLGAGSYYLCASSNESWPARSGGTETLSYATTYYPGVLGGDDALGIPVRAGEALADLDFRLRVGVAFRIKGRVVDEQGNPAAGVNLRLVSVMESGGTTSGFRETGLSTTSSRDGTFEILGVYPGSYGLSTGAIRTSFFRFTVGEEDLTDIEIAVQ